MGILSRKREAGQGIRRCGGLTRLPRIAHFAPGFVSHLRDLRAACIGGDGSGTQMVSQEVFHAHLCQGTRPDGGGGLFPSHAEGGAEIKRFDGAQRKVCASRKEYQGC